MCLGLATVAARVPCTDPDCGRGEPRDPWAAWSRRGGGHGGCGCVTEAVGEGMAMPARRGEGADGGCGRAQGWATAVTQIALDAARAQPPPPAGTPNPSQLFQAPAPFPWTVQDTGEGPEGPRPNTHTPALAKRFSSLMSKSRI